MKRWAKRRTLSPGQEFLQDFVEWVWNVCVCGFILKQ